MGPLIRNRLNLFLLAASAGSAFGCGSGTAPSVVTPPPRAPLPSSYAGTGFTGISMAGKVPLAGASAQLYAAGTTGNGSAATPLLSTPLTTDAMGAFQVPAGYPCPTLTSQVYLVVRGGNATGTSAASNSAAGLLTVLGQCNSIVSSAKVVVNEATTVAAVYALSQFLATGSGANLGSSATNARGLANAVALARALTDTSTGASPGPDFSSSGSSPTARIDTVANLLHGCIVATAASDACTGLFSTATPNGAVAPTNTVDALLNLVRNPTANVAKLFAFANANAVFAPALTKAPADWTLFINYSGGGMNLPTGLGVDAAGNVWVASYFGAASLFSPLGKPLLPQGITGFGLGASYGLAVDATGNAWVTNEPGHAALGNSISVLTPAGQSASGPQGFISSGLDYPIAVAIDTDASAWVLNFGNSSVTHLSGSGQPLSGTAGYKSSTIAFPVAGAVDAGHNLWVANQATNSVTRVAQDGSHFTQYVCCNGPSGLAIDSSGNVWVANFYGDSVSEISPSGTILSSGAYTGGGLNHPQGIAVDGLGDIWVSSYRGSSLTKLAGAHTAGQLTPGTSIFPATGVGADAALSEPYELSIDASGNVWVSNSGSSLLTEFVGLAPPVKTPLLGPPLPP